MSHNLHNNLGNWCIFPENKLIYQGKWLKPQIVSGAEIMEYFPAAQRRGNKYYFVASKDDCGCCSCRYAAKSSVICRTSSRQLQIRYDQQRDKLLLSLCKSFYICNYITFVKGIGQKSWPRVDIFCIQNGEYKLARDGELREK